MFSVLVVEMGLLEQIKRFMQLYSTQKFSLPTYKNSMDHFDHMWLGR